MKRRMFLLVALTIMTGFGCNQDNNPSSPKVEQQTTTMEELAQLYQQREVEFLASIAKDSKLSHTVNSNCDAEEIHVPEDYSTIRAAVNAACAGSSIFVHVEGSPYNETVTVSQNDLKIIAKGDVTLNGNFIVQSHGVRIEQFNFIIPYSPNIGVWALSTASSLQILNNNFSGTSARVGVVLNVGSKDCLVENNQASGLMAGILVSSDRHAIRHNTCSNSLRSGIQVFGNNCKLTNNITNSNTSDGISINGINNVLEGNICNGNSLEGMDVQSAQNTIGPGNVCNFNQGYGISLTSRNGGNTVTGNRFQCNRNGAIYNLSSSNNIFENITSSPDCD